MNKFTKNTAALLAPALVVLGVTQIASADSSVQPPAWVDSSGQVDEVPTELPLIGPDGFIVEDGFGDPIMVPITETPPTTPADEFLKDYLDEEDLHDAGDVLGRGD